MLVNKAYKFRLYPNSEQELLITKTMGCYRLVFNHFLSLWNDTYERTGKGLTYHVCSSQLPKLKETTQGSKKWIVSLCKQALSIFADSFSRFFKKQSKAPKFKSKKNPVQSYTTKQNKGNISIINNKVKIPKLERVFFAKSLYVKQRTIRSKK